MDGPWEKYQPTAAPTEADGPWAKYQPAPVVAAPQPAVPAAPPVVAQDAPNLNLTGQQGTLAEEQGAAPAAPDRQVQLDLQAADKGGYGDNLISNLIDMTASGMNAGSAAINMGAHAIGANNGQDVTGYIHNPIGGSQNVSDIAGAAYQAATGKKIFSPADMTPEELARYRTIELATNAATTEGFGSMFSKFAKLGLPADVAAPTSNRVQIFHPADTGPTPTSVASAAAAGAGAGVAQDAYDKYGHPIVSKIPVVGPVADAVLNAGSTLAGAAGGHVLSSTAAGAAKLASIPARAVAKPFMSDQGGFTLQDGTRASPKDLHVAADTYQGAAINPAKAADTIAAKANEISSGGPVMNNTGGMSGDPGLVSLEQKMRLDPKLAPKFVQNDQQVQQAARGDVDKIAPETAIGRTFTDTANQMQADKVAQAQANVASTEQQAAQLEQQRVAEAQPVAAAKNTDVKASQALDKNIVDQTLRPMQEKNSAMYAAVDPNKEATVSSDPMIEAAQKVKDSLGTFNSPEKVIPAGLLRRIEGTQPKQELDPAVEAELARHPQHIQDQVRAALGAEEQPATTSIGDIVSVYPELATTEARARKQGNYTLADNIRALRTSMDGVINDAAAQSIDAYHGSKKAFDKFDPNMRGSNTGLDSAKEAYFFGGKKIAESFSRGGDDLEVEPDSPGFLDSLRGKASPEQMAKFEQQVQDLKNNPNSDLFEEMYSSARNIIDGNQPNVRKVTLRARNPLTVDMGGQWTSEGEEAAIAKAKAEGHDGIIMENWNPNPDGEQTPIYAVFDHGQIREEGVPGSPPETRAAAQRALAAKDNWQKTLGTTFGDGPGGPATKFRKDFNADRFERSTTEPSQTAGRFLQPGQPEKAESLKNIIDNSADPTSGKQAAGDYLRADLASSGAVKDGKIDPQALANWRSKWGEDTLATAPDFKKQLDDLQNSATAGQAQAGQLANQLKAHQAALDEATQNNTAFKTVVGKDPTTAVAGIFQSGDPESAMKEIVNTIGQGTAAHDGLKAAVREYLIERATTSALQKTTTGINPISFANLDKLFKQNEKALAAVFSPDEMHSLQVAHTRLKAINALAQQTLPGSATAEREGMVKKLWTATEIVLKSTYGGLEGGNKVRNLKLAAALQGGGPNAVYKVLAEAQFNPELAQVLAKRDLGTKGRKSYDAKLFRSIVLPAAVARNNVDQPTQ